MDKYKLMLPSNIKYIVVHTSVSSWGSVEEIDKWHRERGFLGIGYHNVITNGFMTWDEKKKNKPNPENDGKVWVGRPIQYVGAHCPGFNDKSIGVNLIGKLEPGQKKGDQYTAKQLATLLTHVKALMAKFKIPAANVIGHCETKNGKDQGKTCPDLDMDWLRAELAK